MKMFRIPDPWDYHRYGGFIVLAETPEDAVQQVKSMKEKLYMDRFSFHNDLTFEQWQNQTGKPDYDNVTELNSPYQESGCDC